MKQKKIEKIEINPLEEGRKTPTKDQCYHFWVSVKRPAPPWRGTCDIYSCLNCGQVRQVDWSWGEIAVFNDRKKQWEKIK